MLQVKDKGYGNNSVYYDEVFGLQIDSFTTEDNKGFVEKIVLDDGKEYIELNTVEELINVFQHIIKAYNLKQYSKGKKDILLVYTDNLKKAKGFLQKYITQTFTFYIQILDFIEIRSIECWNPNAHTATDIQRHAQWIFDNVFNVDEYVYLTGNQIVRRRLNKAAKNDDTARNIIKGINFTEYSIYRSGIFGGINYCAYPKYLVDEPVLALDMKSAYIYDLLIEKHCMKQGVEVSPEYWEFYLASQKKASFGKYKISYSTSKNLITCYKDVNGFKLEKGTHEVVCNFTNVDLKIFLDIIHVHEVTCTWLVEYELDYVPKYVRDVLIEEYIKKEKLPKDSIERALEKIVVNGVYGDTIRNYDNGKTYNNYKKGAALAFQWGIWTCSYCKKNLLNLATKLDKDSWLYSATDSVYCLDTPNNRKIIEEVNAEIQAKTKAFCELFGYNYDDLKELGTFQLEAEIVKFKAIKHNQYMYKTKDGEIILKAGGIPNKETIKCDDSLFEMYDLPHTTRTKGIISSDTIEADINGRHYKSEGYYYEIIQDYKARVIDDYIDKLLTFYFEQED